MAKSKPLMASQTFFFNSKNQAEPQIQKEIHDFIKTISGSPVEKNQDTGFYHNQFYFSHKREFETQLKKIMNERKIEQLKSFYQNPIWDKTTSDLVSDFFSYLRFIKNEWFKNINVKSDWLDNLKLKDGAIYQLLMDYVFGIEMAQKILGSSFKNSDGFTNLAFGLDAFSEYLIFFQQYHFKFFMKPYFRLETANLNFYDPIFRIKIRSLNLTDYHIFNQLVRMATYDKSIDPDIDGQYKHHVEMVRDLNSPESKAYVKNFGVKKLIRKACDIFFPVINWDIIGVKFPGPLTTLKLMLLSLEYGLYMFCEVPELMENITIFAKKLIILENLVISQKEEFLLRYTHSEWLVLVKKLSSCRLVTAKIVHQMMMITLDHEIDNSYNQFRGPKIDFLGCIKGFFTGKQTMPQMIFTQKEFYNNQFLAQYTKIHTTYLMVNNEFTKNKTGKFGRIGFDQYIKHYLTFVADIENDFFLTSLQSLIPKSLDYYRQNLESFAIQRTRKKILELQISNPKSNQQIAPNETEEITNRSPDFQSTSMQKEINRNTDSGIKEWEARQLDDFADSKTQDIDDLMLLLREESINMIELSSRFTKLANQILDYIHYDEDDIYVKLDAEKYNSRIVFDESDAIAKLCEELGKSTSKAKELSLNKTVPIQLSFVMKNFLHKLLSFLHLVGKTEFRGPEKETILRNFFLVLIKICYNNSQSINALFSPNNASNLQHLIDNHTEAIVFVFSKIFVKKFTFNVFLRNPSVSRTFFIFFDSTLRKFTESLEFFVACSQRNSKEVRAELLATSRCLISIQSFVKKFLQPCKYKKLRLDKLNGESQYKSNIQDYHVILFRQERGKINIKLEIKLANLINQYVFTILNTFFYGFGAINSFDLRELSSHQATESKVGDSKFIEYLGYTIHKLTSLLYHSIKNVYEENCYALISKFLSETEENSPSFFELVKDDPFGRKIVYNLIRIFGVIRIAKHNNMLPSLFLSNRTKRIYDQYDILDLPKNVTEKSKFEFENVGFIDYFLNSMPQIPDAEKKKFFLNVHLPLVFKRMQCEKSSFHSITMPELIEVLENKIIEQMRIENKELTLIRNFIKKQSETEPNFKVSRQILYQFQALIISEFNKQNQFSDDLTHQQKNIPLDWSEFKVLAQKLIDSYFNNYEQLPLDNKANLKSIPKAQAQHLRVKDMRRINVRLILETYIFNPNNLRQIAIFYNLSRAETTEAHRCVMREKLGIQMHHLDYYQKVKIYEDAKNLGISVKDGFKNHRLEILKKGKAGNAIDITKLPRATPYEIFQSGLYMKIYFLHQYSAYKLWVTDVETKNDLIDEFIHSETKIKNSDMCLINYFIEELGKMRVSKSQGKDLFKDDQPDFFLNKKFFILIYFMNNLILMSSDGNRYKRLLYEVFKTQSGIQAFLNLWLLYKSLSQFLLKKPFLVNEYFTLYPSFYVLINFFKGLCEDNFVDFKAFFNERSEIDLVALLSENQRGQYKILNSRFSLAQIIYLELCDCLERSDISRQDREKIDQNDKPNYFYLYNDFIYSFTEFVNGGVYRARWLQEQEFRSRIWIDLIYRVVDQPDDEFYTLKFRVAQFLEAMIESQDQDGLNTLSTQISFDALFKTITRLIAKLFVYSKKRSRNKMERFPISSIWNWRQAESRPGSTSILNEEDLEEERLLLNDWRPLSQTGFGPQSVFNILKSRNPSLALINDLFKCYFENDSDFANHRLLDTCILLKSILMQLAQRINVFELNIRKVDALIPYQVLRSYEDNSISSYFKYAYYRIRGEFPESRKNKLIERSQISKNQMSIWYFLRKIIASVELAITNDLDPSAKPKIILYHYKLHPIAFFFSNEMKTDFLKGAVIKSRDAKLKSFNDDFKKRMRKLETRIQIYQGVRYIYYLNKNEYSLISLWLLFLISLTINVLMLVYYSPATNNFDFPTRGDVTDVVLGLNIVNFVVCGFNLICHSIRNLILFFKNLKDKRSFIFKKTPALKFLYFFYMVLPIEHQRHRYQRVFTLSLIAFILAQTWSYFWFTITLNLVLMLVPILFNVINSTIQNAHKLAILLLLIFSITNCYAVLIMKYFAEEWNLSDSLAYQGEKKICPSFAVCVLNSFSLGIRFGGGLGDGISQSTDLADKLYFAQYFFIIIFFTLIQLLLLGAFLGIVIDSFKAHRDETNKRKEDLKENCFICGLSRETFEKNGFDFRHHVTKDHDLFLYFSFLYYMSQKPSIDKNGIEIYISNKLGTDKQNDFYPKQNCLLFVIEGIKVAASDSDGDSD